jgi:hypothetical protein
VLIGGMLIRPDIAQHLLAFDFPLLETGVDTVGEMALTSSASCTSWRPSSTSTYRTPASITSSSRRTRSILIHEFNHCLALLWRDKLGQISLAVTTLFWGAGATLQFIVIKWAEVALGLGLSKASMLQGVVAVGVAAGAIIAAKFITLRKSVASFRSASPWA